MSYSYDFQSCGSETRLEFDLCEDGGSVVAARGGHPGLGNHVFSGSRQRKGMVSLPLYYLESHFSMTYTIDIFVAVAVVV